jgi:hypothetical protein
MNSRRAALLVVVTTSLVFVALGSIFGCQATWSFWGIPTMSPPFADLRVITHGAESVSRGWDPLISNPSDPWGRPLNYPRIWQGLYLLGIDRSHTIELGCGIITCFLVALVMVLPNAGTRTIFFLLGALISPAILLGIERGNIDLFIFFVVACAICCVRRSAWGAGALIMFGVVLKLYPFFAVSLFLREGRFRFFRYASLMVACLVAYAATMWSELRLISRATPRAVDISYGMNVAWMRISQIDERLGGAVYAGCVVLLLVAVGLALIGCMKPSACVISDESEGSFALDSFRVGSSIYIGTFLLGNNFDYRLAFLILAVPQLSVWIASGSGELRWLSGMTLGAMLVSMWHLSISKLWGVVASHLIQEVPITQGLPWLLDELSNWLLFLLMVYTFALALPQWAKDLVVASFRQIRCRCHHSG